MCCSTSDGSRRRRGSRLSPSWGSSVDLLVFDTCADERVTRRYPSHVRMWHASPVVAVKRRLAQGDLTGPVTPLPWSRQPRIRHVSARSRCGDPRPHRARAAGEPTRYCRWDELRRVVTVRTHACPGPTERRVCVVTRDAPRL